MAQVNSRRQVVAAAKYAHFITHNKRALLHIIGTYRHWISCAAVTFGAEAIQSANIVGFNTVTIKAGAYNMFAVNFENISDTEGISIQDLIPGTTPGLGAGSATTGDEIQVYDSEKGSYKKYYLQYVTMPKPAMVNNYKWIDISASAPATIKFKNGDSFWYHSRAEEDVTISLAGGVSLAQSQEINIVSGYNMIGSAFPANFNPNSLGTEYWQNCGAFAGSATTGDEIQVYDPAKGSYKKYYLQYVTMPKPAMVNNYKWIDVNASAPVAVDTEVLSIGKGVWYKHNGSGFTLTIPSPIAK